MLITHQTFTRNGVHQMLHIYKILLLSTVISLSACVTGTRQIALEVPTQTSSNENVGTIQIVGINDNRVFEQKPSKPEIPSSKNTVADLSAETKATLIGRQRNGYGGAMGDVSLIDGVSVQSQMQELLTSGLNKRGYSVVKTADKKLTVDIEKFWAWMVPGFISIGFESQLQTKLTLNENGVTKTSSAAGNGNNEGQVASNANWALTYKRAYNAFLVKLDTALEELGL